MIIHEPPMIVQNTAAGALPLDEVIFYNSGMKFQAIYGIRDRVRPILKQRGIRFTEVKICYDDGRDHPQGQQRG